MPIPSSAFKTDVCSNSVVVTGSTIKRNCKKNSTNDNVSTVETSKSIKGRAVNTFSNSKWRIKILITLKKSKKRSKD